MEREKLYAVPADSRIGVGDPRGGIRWITIPPGLRTAREIQTFIDEQGGGVSVAWPSNDPVFEKRTTIERGRIEIDGDGVETIEAQNGYFDLCAIVPPEANVSSPPPGYIPGDEGPPGRFEIVVRFWPEKVEK